MSAHTTLLLEVGGLLAALLAATLLARWTGQSPIPLFILMGLPLNPPREAADVVGFLATLGVSLLLFLIGLEFSPRRLAKNARRLLPAGVMDFLLNFPLGMVAGRLLGFSWLAAAFLAGAVYMSSSAIISRGVLEAHRGANRETEPLLGLLVVEDIAVAVLLALLTSVAAGGALLAAGAVGIAKLALLVACLLGAARLLRRPLWRLLGSDSSEVLLLFLLGVVVLTGAASAALGLSEALGAFLVGTVLGDTPYRERIEQTLLPFQQLSAAMFFIAFGIQIDLAEVAPSLLPALALLVVFSLTKLATGLLVGRSWGLPRRATWRLGLSLAPRGEFSILLGALAAAMLVEGPRLAALVGAYVVLSALTGAVLLHHADRLAVAVVGPRQALR
ncbi:MAG: cation:proton antiporter [Gemmatimonadetes bacterium]|nr:cation:proton antiporter [Gemmatimonadota bacterium]